MEIVIFEGMNQNASMRNITGTTPYESGRQLAPYIKPGIGILICQFLNSLDSALMLDSI